MEAEGTEPPTDAGEAEMVLYALDRCRRTFAWKCGGLDAGQLRRQLPPSDMTLAGLVKHLALVEDHYTSVAFTGAPMGPPWNAVEPAEWPDWEWRSAVSDAPEDLYALWHDAVARSRASVAEFLQGRTMDDATRMTTASGQPVNARRILVDLHEEYARHVGHADLLRQSIDGLVGEDLPRQSA